MDEDRFALIEAIADEFRKSRQMNIPIEMEAIIQSWHGVIEHEASAIGGAIIFYENGNFAIKVPSYNFSDVNIRFIIAREIGHLILHLGILASSPKKRKKNINMDMYYFSIPQELDASRFARAFLMPAQQYKEKLLQAMKTFENIEPLAIESVAKSFKVPVLEVVNRGRELGGLNYDESEQ